MILPDRDNQSVVTESKYFMPTYKGLEGYDQSDNPNYWIQAYNAESKLLSKNMLVYLSPSYLNYIVMTNSTRHAVIKHVIDDITHKLCADFVKKAIEAIERGEDLLIQLGGYSLSDRADTSLVVSKQDESRKICNVFDEEVLIMHITKENGYTRSESYDLDGELLSEINNVTGESQSELKIADSIPFL